MLMEYARESLAQDVVNEFWIISEIESIFLL